METIKLKIKPLSSFKSKLQSDTIFGMFCWMYKYLYGEEDFVSTLKDYDKSPFIIFSDGFLEDTLPRPVVKPENIDIVESIVHQYTDDIEIRYSLLKKIKNVSSLDIEEIQGFLNDNPVKESSIINAILQSMFDRKGNLIHAESNKKFIEHNILKNSVNRILNTTTEGLYVSHEYYINSNIEIYVKFDDLKISIERIKEIFEAIGKTGFGADKSTGKGRFEIIEIFEEFDIKDNLLPERNQEKNGFVSLSSGLLLDDSVTLNFGKTFTKFGKLGGDKAISGNHFKNPIILFKAGSTFFIKEHKEFYGNATNKVFADQQGFHSGFMIPLFLNLEKEV